jgi:DNA invertase Pin-like site-specific DNA recombinase
VELARCLDYVRDDQDPLVITRLDRLARSMVDLCTIVASLQAKGVQLLVLDQAIDTTRPAGRLTFHLLSAIAEFETDLRRERQMEGIAHAKAHGVHFGRTHALTPVQVAALRQRRAQGVLIKVLMQEYGLSKAAIYRYLAAPQGQAEAAD